MAGTKDQQPGAGEKATLLGVLDGLRGSVAAKVDGVPEPQVRDAGVPSGTTLLGLVKHLTFVEGFYFLGEGADDWAVTWRLRPEETVEDVLAGYRHAVRR